MAFNPLRGKKIDEPEMTEEHSEREQPTPQTTTPRFIPNAASHSEPTVPKEVPTVSAPSVEAQSDKVNPIPEKNAERQPEPSPQQDQQRRHEVSELETVPFDSVLKALRATQSPNDENVKIILGSEYYVSSDGKWRDLASGKSGTGVINFVKRVIVNKEKIADEQAQFKRIFAMACKFLSPLYEAMPHQNENNAEEQKEANDSSSTVASNDTIPESSPSSESAYATLRHKLSDGAKKEDDDEHEMPKFVGEEQPAKELVKESVPAWKKRTPAENAEFWKNLTEQLDNISLELVLEHVGANANEDGQQGKWKIWATSDNMQVSGQEWYSWKSQVGGRGALSFMAFHLAAVNNIDDRYDEQRKIVRKMAIRELIKAFGDGDLSEFATKDEEIVYKQPFSTPITIDGKIDQVRKYLNEKRGLPMWIINKQIKTGLLFAGFPADWHLPRHLNEPEKLDDNDVWATFLAVNNNAAEMRGIKRTDAFAKILAKGSEKELGGFLLKAERDCSEHTVSALEASIDAMSYHAFYPGRIAFSCMGVNFNLAVSAATEALEYGHDFQLAFDNDLAGNEAAVRFKARLAEELGEEECSKLHADGRVKYYDLGLKVLEESVKNGKTFYFDVCDDKTGHEAIKLFQEQASNRFGKEAVRKMLDDRLIKYANVCPKFGLVKDAKAAAQEAFDKIASGKPYYLRFESSFDNEQEAENAKAFEKSFKEIAGSRYGELELNGSVIFEKPNIPKDWNEYYLHVKNNDLSFQDLLKLQEAAYSDYSKEPKGKRKPKAKP